RRSTTSDGRSGALAERVATTTGTRRSATCAERGSLMTQLDPGTSAAAWLVAYGAEPPGPRGASRWAGDQTAGVDTLAGSSQRRLELLAAPATWPPSLAEGAGCRIVF